MITEIRALQAEPEARPSGRPTSSAPSQQTAAARYDCCALTDIRPSRGNLRSSCGSVHTRRQVFTTLAEVFSAHGQVLKTLAEVFILACKSSKLLRKCSVPISKCSKL